MREPLRFEGVMPANLLPFRADLSIDEPAYRRHLRWLADTRGVTGLVVNGHAAEVASLDREERRRALGVALDEVAGKVPVVAGRLHGRDGRGGAARQRRPRGRGGGHPRSFPRRCSCGARR